MSVQRVDHRQRGAYYTPAEVTDYMAAWVLERKPKSVLEPSVGDGAFLSAIQRVARRESQSAPKAVAVELSRDAIEGARQAVLGMNVKFEHRDFMTYAGAKHNAVIGNPPFVRLRHLPPSERVAAVSRAEAILGQPMDPAGSTWMPFLLHATTCLAKGGCLSLVLPLDITFVRYARPLWAFLARSFGALRLVRVKERLFPSLSQDVVILFADKVGSTSSAVRFEAFESLRHLQAKIAVVRRDVNVSDVILGDRAFLRALLPEELTDLLAGEIELHMSAASKSVRFRIGYVAGDKSFFHPSREQVRKFELRRSSLVPALASARSLRQAGLRTSEMPGSQIGRLFLPRETAAGASEARYIRFGEASGVSEGYKCRIRTPWYIVPSVSPPDLILSVFSDRPVLAINDGGLAASNSFLCGTVVEGDPESVACRWYNSLTLLECELNVHALGGGVFVMVPREAAAVRLLKAVRSDTRLLRRIDSALRSGDLAKAYQCGDDAVMRAGHSVGKDGLDLIRLGAETLRSWRNPTSFSETQLVEDFDEELALLEA